LDAVDNRLAVALRIIRQNERTFRIELKPLRLLEESLPIDRALGRRGQRAGEEWDCP